MFQLAVTVFLFIVLFNDNVVQGWTTLLPAKTRQASIRTLLFSSSSTQKTTTTNNGISSDDFLIQSFTDCDSMNVPPSLNVILKSIHVLSSQGSDIRGKFVDHAPRGSLASVYQSLKGMHHQPALTPFASFCLGNALATQIAIQKKKNQVEEEEDAPVVIAIGQDPRSHGMRLADALARGAESAGAKVLYTRVATTPACAAFARMGYCDAAVMVTASHLPLDKNGFKFYTEKGGFTKGDIQALGSLARSCAEEWYNRGILPPTSGDYAVMCSEHVDWMPSYAESLKTAIVNKTGGKEKPLQGLKIILNAGHGTGGFFRDVLEDLGADMSDSMYLEPDGNFPKGIPNPEDASMFERTAAACENAQADLGIMLDTDADRCGFCVPRAIKNGKRTNYEVLNRNRLIALLGVIFSRQSPGCAVVTDSVTSEGLSKFLTEDLGLTHVRYLKGYANVINKAMELTESGTMNAELAIETSGHCAMKENGYLDDGTYTAVQVVSLLANLEPGRSLLELISNLEELDEVSELRMTTYDGQLETMQEIFAICESAIESQCEKGQPTNDGKWFIDEENLEGIRVRLGNGQFFMLRKSLHDPIISLQIEAQNKDEAKTLIVEPLLELLESKEQVLDGLDLSVLRNYGK